MFVLTALAAGATMLSVPTPGGLLCTVESALNTSISERLPLPAEPIRHAAGDLQAEGGSYTRFEELQEADFDGHARHEIDPRTGRFTVTQTRALHDIGEHHEVVLTGTCQPVPEDE